MERPLQRTALVVGISGQDGSYLAELLVAKGYRVVGVVRGSPTTRFANLAAVEGRIELVQCDLRDTGGVSSLVARTQPDEVYNLAGTTNVAETWEDPLRAADETAIGAFRLLESLRRDCPRARMFQASSSEMFGQASHCPQNE